MLTAARTTCGLPGMVTLWFVSVSASSKKPSFECIFMWFVARKSFLTNRFIFSRTSATIVTIVKTQFALHMHSEIRTRLSAQHGPENHRNFTNYSPKLTKSKFLGEYSTVGGCDVPAFQPMQAQSWELITRPFVRIAYLHNRMEKQTSKIS